MRRPHKNKKFLLLLLFPTICFADSMPYDPCADLLSVISRPTVAGGVCTVKPGQVIVEMGFQYQNLYPENGYENNFPQGELRFGLPAHNEFRILSLNYATQNTSDDKTVTGYNAVVAGFKHQFQPMGQFFFAGEGLLTLPSGSADFGSDGLGAVMNAIGNYNFTKTISVGLMLGISSQTTATNDGGERYNSFNPDIVFSWQPKEVLQFYLEFYGQTKTGPSEADGYNADGGIQYLLTKDIEIDIEYGQRLTGQLGGFENYFGFGGGIRF